MTITYIALATAKDGKTHRLTIPASWPTAKARRYLEAHGYTRVVFPCAVLTNP